MRPIIKRNNLPIVILLFVVSLFFWKVIFLGYVTFPINIGWDPVATMYPHKWNAADMIRGGIIPLWNPYVLCGTPLLADVISAPFSPLDILFYLFPTPLGYSLLLMVYLLFGGLFSYLYMREIRVSKTGSIVSMFAFMFNGTIMSTLLWRVHVGTIMWFPLMLLLFERVINKKIKINWVILAGVVLGITLLTGHPQSSMYMWMIGLIYAVFRLAKLKLKLVKKEIIKISSLVLLIFLIGILIGMVQILPSYEFADLSSRSYQGETYIGRDGMTFSELTGYLLISFIPEFFYEKGIYMPDILHLNYHIPLPFIPEWQGPIPRQYLGFLSILLVLFGMFFRKDWPSRFFTGVAIGMIVFFLIVATPVKSIIATIPIFGSLLHIKALTIYMIILSFLAGLGADHLLYSPKGRYQIRKFLKPFFVLWTLVFSTSIAITVIGENFFRELGYKNVVQTVYSFQKVDYYVSWFWNHFNIFSHVIYVPILLGGACLILFWLHSSNKLKIKPAQFIICSLIILDLFYYNQKTFPFFPDELFYPETETVRFLKQENEKCIFRVVNSYKLGTLIEEDEDEDRQFSPSQNYTPTIRELQDPLKYIGFSDFAYFANTLLPHKIQSAIGYESLVLKRYADFMLSIDENCGVEGGNVGLYKYSSKLLNLMNVKYLLSTKVLNSEHLRLVLDGDVKVYENKEVLPRAFIVPSVKIMDNDGEILREIQKQDFDFEQYAILEETPDENYPLSGQIEGSMVEILDYNPNKILIEANMTGNGFLVLSDTYYPGWNVYMDGERKKLYRTNYLFRGVFLPEGNHKVVFVYQPQSFMVGFVITITALTLIVLFFSFRGYKYLKTKEIKKIALLSKK